MNQHESLAEVVMFVAVLKDIVKNRMMPSMIIQTDSHEVRLSAVDVLEACESLMETSGELNVRNYMQSLSFILQEYQLNERNKNGVQELGGLVYQYFQEWRNVHH